MGFSRLPEKVDIQEIEWHRNGVGGAGFHAVLFTMVESGQKHNMLGIVFQEQAHVAVFDRDLLAEGNILFGTNSWRGDVFEGVLREEIAKREEKPFSSPLV